MAISVLCVDMCPEVRLEQDLIYRIGSRLGVEVYNDDQSIEPAHATITLLSAGVICLASVAGKVYVNGHDTQRRKITNRDALNGDVDIHFGNVSAKLKFSKTANIEEVADKGMYIKYMRTNASSNINDVPATRPPSVNAMSEEANFSIPETQDEISIEDPEENNKIDLSTDSDFVIPETQDPPMHVQTENQEMYGDDSSELGPIIRMPTPEYNANYDDAIDDFDSSLLIGDYQSIFECDKSTDKDKADQFENIPSCHNRKVKNDKGSQDQVPLANDVPCTQYIFDELSNEKQYHPTHTPAHISTIIEKQDNYEDFLETQLFPAQRFKCNGPSLVRKDQGPSTDDDLPCTQYIFDDFSNEKQSHPPPTIDHISTMIEKPSNYEDFLETHAFPSQRQKSNGSSSASKNQKLSADDDVPGVINVMTNPKKTHVTSVSDEMHTLREISMNTKENQTIVAQNQSDYQEKGVDEDFIETPVFPNMINVSGPGSSHETQYLKVTAIIHKNPEDFKETQLFSPRNERLKKTGNIGKFKNMLTSNGIISDDEQYAENIQLPNSLSMNDDIDQHLINLISLSALSSSSSDEELLKPNINSGLVEWENKENKVQCQKRGSAGVPDRKCEFSILGPLSGPKTKRSRKRFQWQQLNSECAMIVGGSTQQLQDENSKKKLSLNIDKEKGNQKECRSSVYAEKTLKLKTDKSALQYKDFLKNTNISTNKSNNTLPDTDTNPVDLFNDSTLQDMNAYLNGIKNSGRKLQLAHSTCNLSLLRPLLTLLKDVFEITEDPLICDLLIMDKGERTYKFLVAVAANKPILSSSWIQTIKQNRSLVVETRHLLKDAEFEEKFKFNPLLVMKFPRLLKNINFILGDSIQPAPKNMKAIIESAGGAVLLRAPSKSKNIRLYAVTTVKDKAIVRLFKNYDNVTYIESENVMKAVVQHNVELLDERKLKL